MTYIIQCSEKKDPFALPMRAEDRYTSQLFRCALRFVRSGSNPWVIYSASHGLIWPWHEIDNYDISIEQSMIPTTFLALQAVKIGGPFISLCGKRYNRRLTKAGIVFEDPCKGLGCGQRKNWYLTHSQ